MSRLKRASLGRSITSIVLRHEHLELLQPGYLVHNVVATNLTNQKPAVSVIVAGYARPNLVVYYFAYK